MIKFLMLLYIIQVPENCDFEDNLLGNTGKSKAGIVIFGDQH